MERKSFVLISLIVSCALLVQFGCQQQAKEPTTAPVESTETQQEIKVLPEPDKPSPEITFEKLDCNFGEIGPNTDNSGEFKFTNTGDALLEITKVGKCCGVVATLDKMEYAPGESGVLKVNWKSGSQPIVFRRKLTVYSNDVKNPELILSIEATTVLKVSWEPKRLRLFHDEENAGCQKIIVSSTDNQPFSITGFTSTSDCITADFDPSVEATKFVLEPKVDTEKLQKNLKGRININLTHPQGNTASILFDVLPKYTVNPPLLLVFNAEPGVPIVRKISVLNNYGKDFEIESVSSKDNIVAVKVLEQNKIRNGSQLSLEITPLADEQKLRFTDVFTLNIKGGEILTITCNGYYSKKNPKPQTP